MADEEVVEEAGPPVWASLLFMAGLMVIMWCWAERFGYGPAPIAVKHQWESIANVERRMNAEGRTLYGPKGAVDSTYTSGKEMDVVYRFRR